MPASAAAYQAPEQLMFGSAASTCASDVWGFGAVAVHMLSGVPPFEGLQVRQAAGTSAQRNDSV